jgi:hypothetical protein
MERGQHIEMLQPLRGWLLGAVRNQSPIGYSKGPGLAHPAPSNGRRQIEEAALHRDVGYVRCG